MTDTDNEYLREFRAASGLAATGDFNAWLQKPSGSSSYERRRASVRRYAFAVPDNAALEAIARCAPIVELGAGTGYWAYLLRARGVDIVAYDLAVPGKAPNPYKFEARTWTTVLPGGVEVLENHPARTLFLCWPGYRDDFADQALAAYPGTCLIYIGEDVGGNTANPAFFERLERDWRLSEQIAIPQWPGAHDSLRIYYRQKPLS